MGGQKTYYMTLVACTKSQCKPLPATYYWCFIGAVPIVDYPFRIVSPLFVSSHLSPLTLEVVGAPHMTFPSFPVFRCPQGISKPHSCPFLDVIFLSLLLSSSPSCSFHCPLQNCLRHARGSWDVAIPSEFPFFTMVRRSSCTSVAFWILLRTSSFVTWSL